MTLQKLKSKAAELGAEIEVFSPDGINYDVQSVAPDGMQWVESGGVSLLKTFWNYDKASRYEAYQDIYDRMCQGLEESID